MSSAHRQARYALIRRLRSPRAVAPAVAAAFGLSVALGVSGPAAADDALGAPATATEVTAPAESTPERAPVLETSTEPEAAVVPGGPGLEEGQSAVPGPAEPVIAPQAQPEPEPQVEPEAEPQVEPEAEAQPDPEPQVEPEAGPQVEPDPELQAQPEAEPQAQPEAEPQVEPEGEAQPDPEPQAQPDPEPQAQPDPEPQAQPDPEPQAQPDPEPQAQPGPEPQTQPEAEPQAQPDPAPAGPPAASSQPTAADAGGGSDEPIWQPRPSAPLVPPSEPTQGAVVAASGWGNPAVGRLTSDFGHRVHPVLGIVGMHMGQDVANACGTPIHAAAAGTVVWAGGALQGRTGNQLVIAHGNGVVTRYGHLLSGSFRVQKGDEVRAGQQIAGMGGDVELDPLGAGNSTGCHLHFEVNTHHGLVAVDPVDWLAERGVALGVDEPGLVQGGDAEVVLATAAALVPAEAGPSFEELVAELAAGLQSHPGPILRQLG